MRDVAPQQAGGGKVFVNIGLVELELARCCDTQGGHGQPDYRLLCPYFNCLCIYSIC